MSAGALLAQGRLMLAIIFSHAFQHLPEGRQAVARRIGEIRTAKKRPLVIRRQEHGKRPAARSLGEHLLRDLVDAVDIRALFAIHFDIDEVLVQESCGVFVLKAFLANTMTPKACTNIRCLSAPVYVHHARV
jgi:hypothetical protein